MAIPGMYSRYLMQDAAVAAKKKRKRVVPVKGVPQRGGAGALVTAYRQKAVGPR